MKLLVVVLVTKFTFNKFWFFAGTLVGAFNGAVETFFGRTGELN